uniref:ABC transporter domain-containing protein n=1 Tax=Tetranychus urticae TaxID=32264 RepID=T1K7T0_TETUR
METVRNIIAQKSKLFEKSKQSIFWIQSTRPQDSLKGPIDLSWINVSVYSNQSYFNQFIGNLQTKFNLPSKGIQPHQIINDISGEAKHGNILAIMGSSGSGTILLNGKPSTVERITSCSAYVQQDDIFLANLTAREHLMYQAKLRMSPDTSQDAIIKRVEEVILELSLTKCADTIIGLKGSKKSISGGEMKRLAFASEILTNPSILFCDEPTSGLDSYMAYNVVSLLKSMANSKRTIIITIHQPSSDIFALLDQLLLISEGRLAFIGTSADALKFYSSLGMECPSNYNPADFFIQKISISPGNEQDDLQMVNMICDEFIESSYGQSLKKRLTQSTSIVNSDAYQSMFGHSLVYRSTYLTQFWVILSRSFLCNWREYSVTSTRFLETIALSLIMGFIYLRQEYNQESIMNITGALFMILINNTITPAVSVVNTFCHELPVFVREHNSGLYRVNVYFLCKTIAELPFFLILPSISLTICYWMINLNPNGTRFMVSLACIILVTNVSTSFGYLVGCLCQSLNAALSIAPTAISSLLIFAGLPINQRSIPKYIAWGKYLSWPYYGNEILVVNQWKGVKNISCPYWLNNRYITSTPYGHQIIDCTVTGEGVINKLSFSVGNVNFDFAMLFVLIVAFRLTALLGLHHRARSFR